MGSVYTKYDLDKLTDYQGFESFCDDLMCREGYGKIEPLGGYKDKGRDALHISSKKNKVTIFSYSAREDWKKKLNEDLEKIKRHKHKCDNICYVTASELGATDRDAAIKMVKENYGWNLTIFDHERIATLVDSKHPELKKLHNNIFQVSSEVSDGGNNDNNPLDKKKYAEHMIAAHEEWFEKFTPLLARFREVETMFVLSSTETDEQKGVSVVQLPDICQLTILLGESGAGKTTALWKIVVEASKRLSTDNSAKLPIMISFRSWSDDYHCRDLVQAQFSYVDAGKNSIEKELKEGNCLILIDGLNEVSADDLTKREAYKDLQNFIVEYPNNQYIICCRASDYSSQMLDLEQMKSHIPRHEIYEIKRLDREQLIDYVVRYFKETRKNPKELLDKLDIENTLKWSDKSSVLHLARIPLYLQLIIVEYEQSGMLPNNRAKLLKALIYKIMNREGGKNAAFVDIYAKEQLLGSLASVAVDKDYSLRIPIGVFKPILNKEILDLKKGGLIDPKITYGSIYQELLSNNFFKQIDLSWIDWVHQLVMEYFLACSIVSAYSVGNVGVASNINKKISLRKKSWEQACIIALGILDLFNGARFLRQLFKIDYEIARLAFESLDFDDAFRISEAILDQILKEEDFENENLIEFVCVLSYPQVVEVLANKFKASSKAKRVKISEAISTSVLQYYFLTKPKNSFVRTVENYKIESELKLLDGDRIVKAVKKEIELLDAWIGSKHEEVRFYAAKGLWEENKVAAARALKELIKSCDEKIVFNVNELMDAWGIE